eukprot:GHVL01000547.1.p1 GENE.GHVL01000547.1~~GHVL01000547.1.p1  ORF type:complete len:107 (+),score=44.45 GHVL01000547.1:22-321(+)
MTTYTNIYTKIGTYNIDDRKDYYKNNEKYIKNNEKYIKNDEKYIKKDISLFSETSLPFNNSTIYSDLLSDTYTNLYTNTYTNYPVYWKDEYGETLRNED